MTPEAIASPNDIAISLLTQYPLSQYPLAVALDRAGCPAVCAELRRLAGVKLELPTFKQVEPVMSRV